MEGEDHQTDCTVDDFHALDWGQRAAWVDAFVQQYFLEDWFVDIKGALGVLANDPNYGNMEGWAAYMDAAVLQAINDGMRMYNSRRQVGEKG